MTAGGARPLGVAFAPEPPRSRAARRRGYGIWIVVAICHVLVLAHLGTAAKLPRPIPFDDAPALTVSLLPSLTSAGKATTSPEKPAAPAPAPEDVSVQPATVAGRDLVLDPVQLAPISLTAQPLPLAIPSQGASPTSPRSVQATDAQRSACDFTGALQAALQASPQVLDELSHIPREGRSVANAIMLWDGRWAPLQTPGYSVMTDPLRQTILASILSLPATCQREPIAGPRLLIIADPQGATVIAVGSGDWRWVDLLEPEEAQR